MSKSQPPDDQSKPEPEEGAKRKFSQEQYRMLGVPGVPELAGTRNSRRNSGAAASDAIENFPQ